VTSFDATKTGDGATAIEANRRLDMVATPSLPRLIASTVTHRRAPLVVDLRGVAFMNSSGLGALLSGLRTTRHPGADLRIAGAGQPGPVSARDDQDRQSQPTVCHSREALRAR